MTYKFLKNRAKAPHYNDAGHPQEGEYRFTDWELYEYTKQVCEEQMCSNVLIVDVNEFQF